MKTYSATTDIRSSTDRIWEILVDADSYPEWDPGISRIEGRFMLGQRVKFYLKNNPDKAFAVEVTTFEPGNKLVLTGAMPLGLFKSKRTHTLTPNPDGTTIFHTEEIFGGPLLRVFGSRMPDLTENFENFAAGLKARAES
jgi:uncharacterized protein YndB with AHSA1/START domain